ncbi:MAG: PASTA domain-containing protein [Bacteroidales bacterium]|nr:PASTA domain-containing protein [Bacteroidales bacterium]
MSLGRFLISKVFLKNLLYAFLITISLIFLVLVWLRIYTRHGQKKEVPDFYGLTVDECQPLLKKEHFVLVVQDSVYTKEVPPGTIVEQNPKAGSMVKKGRKIFLIINAIQPEIVPVPYVVGYSLRQAKALLESNGFQLGNLKYVPDIAINNVLKETYQERELKPGDSLEKGVPVDLVLGKGLSNQKTPLPDFTGMTMTKAEQVIISAALNKGAMVYDSTVHNADDSMAAFVWKQSPPFKEDQFVPVGSSVYLWLTLDSAKLPAPDTITIEELPVPNEK